MILRTIVFTLIAIAEASAQTKIPIVVELFTSEGCSSCPPADDLLTDIEESQPVQQADVIVLSEHVDYWNSLGWKDPFSSAALTARQQSYASLLHSDDTYTPQAIIDGRYTAVGSNRQKLLALIKSAASEPKPALEIAINRSGNMLAVQGQNLGKGTLYIAITQSKAVSSVLHGENRGRTLNHVGVVRSLTKAATGQAQIALNSSWGSNLRVVAFVQDPASGRILQAVQKQL